VVGVVGWGWGWGWGWDPLALELAVGVAVGFSRSPFLQINFLPDLHTGIYLVLINTFLARKTLQVDPEATFWADDAVIGTQSEE